MWSRAVTILSLCITLLLFLFRCDTVGNLDPVYNDYFVKYYGDEGAQYGVDMLVNEQEGTLILLGTSITPTASKQVFLVKTDFNGNVIWKKSLGGPNDEAKDIEFDNGGGYVILTETIGESVLGDGSRNAKIMKVSADGVQGQTLVYYTPKQSPEKGGTFANEYPSTITPVAAGYILTGSTDYNTDKADGGLNNISDVLYVLINNDLTLPDFQETTFSNSQNEFGFKTVETLPGKYYTFASSYKSLPSNTDPPNNNFNFWVVPKGQTSIEDYAIGIDELGQDEQVKAICPVRPERTQPPNGYFIVGSHSSQGMEDIYVGQVYEDNGELKKVQREAIDGIIKIGGSKLTPVSVCQSYAREEGYLILANEGDVGFRNIWLVKVAVQGGEKPRVLWSSRFGAGERNDDTGGAVAELPDGRILVLGTVNLGGNNFRMSLFKLNGGGKLDK